jgi:hypothetical protein
LDKFLYAEWAVRKEIIANPDSKRNSWGGWWGVRGIGMDDVNNKVKNCYDFANRIIIVPL